MIENTEQKNKKTNIENLTDGEFLSFLYAERDRENSLSQYHGWNNWALIGAIVTVICALYSVLKPNKDTICLRTVFLYVSGLVAVVLSMRAFLEFFRRPRGIDYSKLRLLKELAPVLYMAFILVCSGFFVTVLALKHMWGLAAWMWLGVLWAYLGAGIYVWVNREQIVPSYYDTALFRNKYVELAFNLVVVWLLSVACVFSFKQARGIQLGPEFETAVCISVILFLVYFLLKINLSNKPVKEFDVIIDNYLYKGETKESTYHKILINRMGMGVLEACKKETASIKQDLNLYSDRFDLINRYRNELDAESVGIDRLETIVNDSEKVLDYLSDLLAHSNQLRRKLGQMLDMVPTADNIPDFQNLMKMADEVLDRVVQIRKVTSEVVEKADAHIQSFYCQEQRCYCPRKLRK